MFELRSIQLLACGLLIACLTTPALAVDSPALRTTGQQSYITGGCYLDYETGETICTYTVYSGTPALSHMIYPMVPVCDEQYTVTSDFFTFESVRTYDDNFCGEIYGMKADQELGENQMATFTITYDGLYPGGMGIVYVALKGGPGCEIFPVEGVIDCTFQPECEFSLDFSVYEYYIRKPGVWAGLGATFAATSNLPINVTFESFGDLFPVQSFGTGLIPAFYATGPAEQTEPPAVFLAPADFNQQLIVIPGDEVEHRFSIWSKLVVGEEVSACDYQDDAIIRVEIENLELYIDLSP